MNKHLETDLMWLKLQTQIGKLEDWLKTMSRNPALIITGGEESIISYASPFGKHTNAVYYINHLSQAKRNQYCDLANVAAVALSTYFSDPQNLRNELVRKERAYLEERNYDLEKDFYFPIPYPHQDHPLGFIFFFANADEKGSWEESLPVVCKKIEEIFTTSDF